MLNKNLFKILCLGCFLSFGLSAEDSKEEPVKELTKKAPKKATKKGYATVDSTKFDFEEGAIEGRMKAPEGFFLRGRASPKLKQLIELRSNFRQELRRSSFGVRALAK